MVIWITGLAGAGKSTVAEEVVRQLRETGEPAFLVDGDAVREVVGDPATGHDPHSRLVNAYRVCRLARLVETQEVCTVVATMSLFHEVHAWNRENFGSYLEVLLEADRQVLEQRRNLYHQVEHGEAQNVVGVDLEPQSPLAPHLVLDNGTDDLASLANLATEILAAARPRW